MFTSTFDNEVHTCHLHIVKNGTVQDNIEDIFEEGKVIPSVPLSLPITDDWLSKELAVGYVQDSEDPYYENGPEVRMEGLAEVIHIDDGDQVLVIVDSKGKLFGKIHVNGLADTMTLNVIMLYALGDRRRRLDRAKNHISSAYIIWYFAALYARKLYGVFARLMIVLPRTTIYKNILSAGALFVKLDDSLKTNLEYRISKSNTPIFHVERMKRIHDEDNTGYGTFGALFHVDNLRNFIEDEERRLGLLRSQ